MFPKRRMDIFPAAAGILPLLLLAQTAVAGDGSGLLNMPIIPADGQGIRCDALRDTDGDGFADIFERERNTDPANARNHPPLWYRLRFVAVRRVVLPVRFRAINDQKQTDPARWDLQINFKQKNRAGKETERTAMARLNGTIQIEGRRYRIKKVERKFSGSSDEAQDQSTIYLEEELSRSQRNKGITPDKLEMQIGKPVYSSDRRPVFEDVGMPEGKRTELVVRKGEKFRMGNYQTGTTDYILDSFDKKKMIARLRLGRATGKQDPLNDELGKPMIVTRDGAIPANRRVIEPVAGTRPTKEADAGREDVGSDARKEQNRSGK